MKRKTRNVMSLSESSRFTFHALVCQRILVVTTLSLEKLSMSNTPRPIFVTPCSWQSAPSLERDHRCSHRIPSLPERRHRLAVRPDPGRTSFHKTAFRPDLRPILVIAIGAGIGGVITAVAIRRVDEHTSKWRYYLGSAWAFGFWRKAF